MFKAFIIALQFLTRLPLPRASLTAADYTPQRLGQSVLFYPLIGVIIGAILIGIPWLFTHYLQNAWPLVQAGIVLFSWVLLTGALHLDGLSDSADAWVGGYGDRERSLAIMKDPYCGPAGVSILVSVLICKYAALTAVLSQSFVYLLFVPVLARSFIILLFLTTPYARKDGLGAVHAQQMSRIAAYSILLLVMLAGAYLLQLGMLWLLVVTVPIFVLMRYLMMQRLGGTTGDTAGAMLEIMELAALLVLALI